jgi:hypothetical protein
MIGTCRRSQFFVPVSPGMRISDETLNLSFSPVLHSDVYKFAFSIETGIEIANFKSIFPSRNQL